MKPRCRVRDLNSRPTVYKTSLIGHTKPGLHKIYDQYAYLTEKRRALELWAGRLGDIIEPPPGNIVKFEGRVQ